MSEPKRPASRAELGDEAVAEWLADNPDFFLRRPEVLGRLKVPHGGTGAAVSLIEKQVDVLRGQNRALERKLVDLIEVARGNDAALELMQAEELPELLADLQDVLRSRFLADEVAIVLFRGEAAQLEGSPARRLSADDPQLAQFANFIRNGRPHCGRLRPQQLELLFGARASEVGSCALIPLGPRAELGLLAVAARSEHQFAPTLGTVYLTHIGELVSAALEPLLR
jgi:uncharacterized protein YigA (DUF484 family)